MNRYTTMKSYLKAGLLTGALALAAGPASAVTHYLAAKAFTKTMPDVSTVPMWGYVVDVDTNADNIGDCWQAAGGAAGRLACVNALPDPVVPGPRLTVANPNTGAPQNGLVIRLTNGLPEPTSIVIPGQEMPDSANDNQTNPSDGPTWNDGSTGPRGTDLTKRVRSFGREAAANGGREDYRWNLVNNANESHDTRFIRPGSYVYHSGTHAQKQVYMGLYGAVTKEAAVGVAYPGVPYDNEVVLFYSDIDPVHNKSIAKLYDPSNPDYADVDAYTTSIRHHPTWFLVNGGPYVDGTTLDIDTGTVDSGANPLVANEQILLRLLSTAGETHVPVLQGLHMSIQAEDGLQYGWEDTTVGTSGLSPREQYSAMLPPLKTKDATVVFPVDGRYAVYDGNGYMTNPSDINNFAVGDEVGGMLRFLAVAAGLAPPIANDDAYTATEDTLLSIPPTGVLANDTEGDGTTVLPGTAVAQLVQPPASGVLTLSDNGSFDYMPDPNVDTADGFTYQVFDSATNLTSNVATVFIGITPVNDLPVTVADDYTTAEDTPLVVDAANGVLANDSDPDGDTLTATVNTAPANGSLVLNLNGSFTYTPNANFNGGDSFTYDVSDGNGGVVTGTVSVVTVTAVNDPPIAGADNYVVAEDNVLTVPAPGVLGNDSDADGDAISIVGNTGTTNGTLAFSLADGSFTYTPNANYNGPDGFSYDLTDGTATVTGTVTIDVTPVNDAPAINSTPITTATEGVTYTYAVTASDVDLPGDTLTFSLDLAPTGMTIDGVTGGISWVPGAGQVGLNDVTVRVTDGGGSFATQSFQVDVAPVVGPPIVLYLSLLNGGTTVDGVVFADEDILSFDGTNFALFFDGSVAGVGGDLFGFDVLDANTILLAFNNGQTLPGGVSITNHDIVAYDIANGTFNLFFDGSDVGLNNNGDRLDGFSVLADGSIVISTRGGPSVPGVTGDADEDLLRFIPTSLGANTSGTWEMYFDASDVGIGGDTDGAAVAANGDIYLSNQGNFSISGVSGRDEDVLVCSSPTTGAASACAGGSLFFDGSAFGLGGNDVDAIDLP